MGSYSVHALARPVNIKAVHVEAFRGFREPFSLKLGDRGLLLIEGVNKDWADAASSNAAGKSLLTREVILWALFGKMARHKDRAISDQPCHPTRGAKVSVEIDDLVISRSRTRKGAAQFSVTRDGVPVRDLSRDPHVRVEDVSRLIGFDYKAFTSAVILGGETSLAEATFAAQMEALESVLRLDELSGAAEVAAKAAQARERTRDQIAMERRFAVQAVAEAQAAVVRVEQEADRGSEIAAIQASLQVARLAADQVPDARVALDVAEVESAAWANAYHDATVTLRQEQGALRDLEAALGQTTCPTCGARLKSKASVAALTTKIEAARHTVQMQEQAVSLAEPTYVREKKNRDAAFATHQALQRAADTIPHLERQQTLLEEQQAGRAARLQEATARLGTAVTQEAEILGRHHAAEILTARATRLVSAFGRDGLQAYVFEAAVPYLNYHAARFCHLFTNGQIQVTFKPTRQSRSEDLIQIAGASAPTFDGCSRGEKERINLVIALSLRELARWRLGQPVNLAVFDETFDGLDEAGIAKVAAFLLDAAKEGGTILVVTHSAALKRMFPGASTIQVIRSGGEAVVHGA